MRDGGFGVFRRPVLQLAGNTEVDEDDDDDDCDDGDCTAKISMC